MSGLETVSTPLRGNSMPNELNLRYIKMSVDDVNLV